MHTAFSEFGLLALLWCAFAACPRCQEPVAPPERGGTPWPGPGNGPFPPMRPGGPGGMLGEDVKLVEQFDKDGDGRLDAAERAAARAFLAERGGRGRGIGGSGRRGGFGGPWRAEASVQPGRKLAPGEVERFADRPLYDPGLLRTLFLEFEASDWEKELADFYRTDVEVPARLITDDRTLEGVGVHFRGMSSFMMVGEGGKRSLNLALDFVHKGQELLGYRTLNLLNAHGDPTFLRAVLYLRIAAAYLPAPKANLVRVVIGGECWGVYVNMQQFDRIFLKQNFGTEKGYRWKAPGSPGGRAGLNYLGEELAAYKRLFEAKGKQSPKAWARLVELCRVLERTPPERLEAALEALLDVEGALRFLALENVLVNSDGYWTRASDYCLYLDEQDRFHIIPYDVGESFSSGMGPGPAGPPGMRGPGRRPGDMGDRPAPGGAGFPGRGPGAGGVELDPLVAASDPGKPLLSKLLAVPGLRTRYLRLVYEIASTWLDWEKLGPLARHYRDLIRAEVPLDTRKFSTTEAFLKGIEDAPETGPEGARNGAPPGRAALSLKAFAEKRRAFLLAHPEVRKAAES